MKLATIISRSKADSNIRTDNVELTPEFANVILTNMNGENRPFSKSLAKLYANELLRGKWEANGENLIFSESEEKGDVLVSGQHRLRGLIIAHAEWKKDVSKWPYAQLTFPTLITRGVQPEVADSVDKGKTRNHTDVLYRSPLVDKFIPSQWNSSEAARKKWCRTLATAARVVWQRADGKTVSSAKKFITSEMLQFIEEEHPHLPEFITLVLNANDSDAGHGGLRKVSLSYIVALGYIACLDADGAVVSSAVDKLDAFLDQLAQGTGCVAGDAAHSLAGFWNNMEPGAKDRDLDISGPIVKALNALMEGDKTTPRTLKLTKKERAAYKDFPILMKGWDETAFEYSAKVKEEIAAEIEDEKTAKAEARKNPVEAKPVEAKPTKKRAVKKRAVKKAVKKVKWAKKKTA